MIDRFQQTEIDGVPTVVDVVEKRFITHAAEWGAAHVATVIDSLTARPDYVELFAWEGMR